MNKKPIRGRTETGARVEDCEAHLHQASQWEIPGPLRANISETGLVLVINVTGAPRLRNMNLAAGKSPRPHRSSVADTCFQARKPIPLFPIYSTEFCN